MSWRITSTIVGLFYFFAVLMSPIVDAQQNNVCYDSSCNVFASGVTFVIDGILYKCAKDSLGILDIRAAACINPTDGTPVAIGGAIKCPDNLSLWCGCDTTRTPMFFPLSPQKCNFNGQEFALEDSPLVVQLANPLVQIKYTCSLNSAKTGVIATASSCVYSGTTISKMGTKSFGTPPNNVLRFCNTDVPDVFDVQGTFCNFANDVTQLFNANIYDNIRYQCQVKDQGVLAMVALSCATDLNVTVTIGQSFTHNGQPVQCVRFNNGTIAYIPDTSSLNPKCVACNGELESTSTQYVDDLRGRVFFCQAGEITNNGVVSSATAIDVRRACPQELDTTPLTSLIRCPSNIVVSSCTPNAVVVQYSVSPVCAAATLPTQVAGLPSGSAFPFGTTTTNTFTVPGDSCSFTVTVTGDVQPPTIECPANRNVCAGSTIFYNGLPNDNCPNVRTSVVQGINSGGIAQLGANTIVLQAIDASSLQSATCSFVLAGVSSGSCSDDNSDTSGDHCVEGSCIGGCFATTIVTTTGCPIADNFAFQIDNTGRKLCTRISRRSVGGRSKTERTGIIIGQWSLVGGGGGAFVDLSLINQFVGDFKVKLIDDELLHAESYDENGKFLEFSQRACFIKFATSSNQLMFGGTATTLATSFI